MRELGMKTAFISGDGVWAKEFVEIAGKAAEGAFITFTPDQTRIKGGARGHSAAQGQVRHRSGGLYRL
ncbi:MAG: hypothetical protein M5R38_16620 [Candidatus Methylomirabilis sp.]|nr:hypothetical protein [Candidatus Methylomirabilis sp.]